jgi:hypothetical protein
MRVQEQLLSAYNADLTLSTFLAEGPGERLREDRG